MMTPSTVFYAKDDDTLNHVEWKNTEEERRLYRTALYKLFESVPCKMHAGYYCRIGQATNRVGSNTNRKLNNSQIVFVLCVMSRSAKIVPHKFVAIFKRLAHEHIAQVAKAESEKDYKATDVASCNNKDIPPLSVSIA